MNNSIGVIKISDDVITVIAGIAASDIKGIYPLFGFDNGSFNKKVVSKGIKVTVSDNTTSIDISVAVDYGIKIPQIVRELQESVKNQIETFTGVKIKGINVYVQKIISK